MKDGLGAVQTVLILGGDSDIANATAERLARQRARTFILAGRDQTKLEARADRLRHGGATRVEVLHFDALDSESHPAFVERAFSRGQDIDLVLLTFGVLGEQLHDEHDARAAVRTAQINYVGAVSVLIPVIESLRAQGHGDVVALSTVAAERPRRSNFIYGSSKAGLDWFCQGYADALVGSGVRMIVVRPGFVRSKMTTGLKAPPLSSTPDEVAQQIISAVARGNEIVWSPPRLRWVMSALRHLPRAVFRRLNL
jgi:decaprenylphospho-beta-D-erythro-pentofuranosid-2-ulose 2-reductase